MALLIVGALGCAEPLPPPGNAPPQDADVMQDGDVENLDADVVPVALSARQPSGCSLIESQEFERDVQTADLALAAGPSEFLMAYVTGFGESSEVEVQPLGAGDANPRRVAADGVSSEPTLVSVGSGWLIAYTVREASGSRVVVESLSPLVLADEESRAAALSIPDASAPALTRQGTSTILAYRSPAGAHSHTLATDGAPVGAPMLVGQGDVSDVRVTASANESFVAWSNSSGHVFGRRVTSTAMGSAAMLNELDPSPTGAFELAFSGSTFSALTSLDELGVETVRFRHITTSGSVLGQPKLLPYRGGAYVAFSLARFAAGFAVAYRHAELGRNQLRLALLDTDGRLLFDTLLESTRTGEGAVVIRQTGDGRLGVAWTDTRSDSALTVNFAGIECQP